MISDADGDRHGYIMTWWIRGRQTRRHYDVVDKRETDIMYDVVDKRETDKETL